MLTSQRRFKMANTTDIIITGNIFAESITLAGYEFNRITNGSICSGQKIICFDSYGTSEKYFSIDDINDIILAFNTELDCEIASMIIDCDTYESKNGVYHFDRGWGL